MKDYIRQIILEIKLLSKSKLFTISASILILFALFGSMIGSILGSALDGGYSYWEKPIVVEDITVKGDSYIYWEVYETKNTIDYMISSDELKAGSEAHNLFKEILYFYAQSANSDLANYTYSQRATAVNSIVKKFILEKNYKTIDEMKVFIVSHDREVYSSIFIELEDAEKLLELTEEQRLQEISRLEKLITESKEVVINADFIAIYKLEKQNLLEQIKISEEKIEELESSITSSNKTEIEEQIKQYELNIKYFKDISIPTIEYKIEKKVHPNNDWRNQALQIRNDYLNKKDSGPLTEKEFNNDRYISSQYDNYADYLKKYQAQLKKQLETYMIAERALELNKPDLFYENSSREDAMSFLSYSLLVGLFGVMLSANAIAREFQNGTVRLLLIRPKNRIKIFASKLIAVLVLVLLVHFLTQSLHLIVIGLDKGFEAFTYPKIYPNSTMPFFIYYIMTLLVTSLPILLLVSGAFFLAALIRKNAPSIAITMAGVFGSSIVLGVAQFSNKFDWLELTPVPYVHFYQYFTFTDVGGYRKLLMDFNTGIVILLILSVIVIGIGLWNLKSRDVTN